MMTAEQLHTQLVDACNATVNNYRDDLTKHDLEAIRQYPGQPFLHFARESGTHLVHLWKRENLPAKGQSVPYLFGTADAKHIAEQIVPTVEFIIAQETCTVAHYYDGQTLRAITMTDALDIAREHYRILTIHFNLEARYDH